MDKPARWLLIITNLFCIHDGAHTHSQGIGGHFGEVSIKESCVGNDGVLRQGLHPRSGHQTGTRLIESNVAVWSNT